jgi:hypothetical protein
MILVKFNEYIGITHVIGKFRKFPVAISIDSTNIALEKVPGGAFSNAWGVQGGELGQ